MGEAEGERRLAVVGELVGMDPAVDRQVLGRRLEILADGEDLDAGVPDVPDRGEDLVRRLADPDHDAGLHPAGVLPRLPAPRRLGEQPEAAVVTAAGAG